MWPLDARYLFRGLTRSTPAHTTRVSTVVLLAFVALLLAVGLLGFLVCLVSRITGRPTSVTVRRGPLAEASAWILLCAAVTMLTFPPVSSAFGHAGVGVEVVRHEQVGVYDVHVLKGAGSGPLIEWLRGGGFHFDDEDKAVFDRYVEKQWYFVAAKVNPKRADAEGQVLTEGLVAPLVLRFETPEAVYPLALTSTVSQPTELLIYVVSHGKTTCDDRLQTAYSAEADKRMLERLAGMLEPQGFITIDSRTPMHITKFRGTLRPVEMKTDLVFPRAPDDKPVRELVIVW